MAKRKVVAKNTKRPKKGIKVSNSPTAVLARKVRKLQTELRNERAASQALADENMELSGRIDDLQDQLRTMRDERAADDLELAKTIPSAEGEDAGLDG